MTTQEKDFLIDGCVAASKRAIGRQAEAAAVAATEKLVSNYQQRSRRLWAGLGLGVTLLAVAGGAYCLGSGRNSHGNGSPRSVATARCVDGTYSFASNHTGACAAHGGVREFYR